ncbi:MAG: hypothetical protein KKG09_00460 [Verrucomicrobia bacterium]|nr:hypothetical protein [Verrucomicrobiota bacterium]MBU4430277.1 hypothetical protein [Verrucomicrobiota bacterium]MBU4496463.1 hypothetical protein [Verrucomicrobiota bacterium]MCG2679675.1 hypothetical protein [Kiritimatiellia bacterium]
MTTGLLVQATLCCLTAWTPLGATPQDSATRDRAEGADHRAAALLIQQERDDLQILAREKLAHAKVASLYENVTDPVNGRGAAGMIRVLRETHTDLIFRGFFRWYPVPESPDEIPQALVEIGRGMNARQLAEAVRASGAYYRQLRETIAALKKEMPDILFCGAIAAQRVHRIEHDPITGKTIAEEDTWKMALDPCSWDIRLRNKPVTKEELQQNWAGPRKWADAMGYDRRKAKAYLPDIANTAFQELLVNLAKKQIDCGADAIWIDGLPQAKLLAKILKLDASHPLMKANTEAAARIVAQIHAYGETRGKRILVGGWAGELVFPDADEEFPYPDPDFDFVTMTPIEAEVEAKRLNAPRWERMVASVRKRMKDVPIFAFIDWSYDASPTVSFSQKLSQTEQREFLKHCDEFMRARGVTFIYPIRGGFMGRGKATTRLSFGKDRMYDSLAPEFETYETIRELARKKANGEK